MESPNILLSVLKLTAFMLEAILIQLKILISILGQCLMSLHSDFMKFDCKSDIAKQLFSIIIEKLHKLVEIAASVKKLCSTVKKEDLNCLPCFGASTKSVKD